MKHVGLIAVCMILIGALIPDLSTAGPNKLRQITHKIGHTVMVPVWPYLARCKRSDANCKVQWQKKAHDKLRMDAIRTIQTHSGKQNCTFGYFPPVRWESDRLIGAIWTIDLRQISFNCADK